MSVMQDLYDSEIPVRLASKSQLGWRVRIGDNTTANWAETFAESWQQLEDWLVREAIERFPESAFAAKYSRRPSHHRPHLTLVQGGMAH